MTMSVTIIIFFNSHTRHNYEYIYNNMSGGLDCRRVTWIALGKHKMKQKWRNVVPRRTKEERNKIAGTIRPSRDRFPWQRADTSSPTAASSSSSSRVAWWNVTLAAGRKGDESAYPMKNAAPCTGPTTTTTTTFLSSSPDNFFAFLF